MDIPDDARGGETLGNPNCRVVVSLMRAVEDVRGKRTPVCIKRIVLHEHGSNKDVYCVMTYNKGELRLVSWNNADEKYGRNEWSLKETSGS